MSKGPRQQNEWRAPLSRAVLSLKGSELEESGVGTDVRDGWCLWVTESLEDEDEKCLCHSFINSSVTGVDLGPNTR